MLLARIDPTGEAARLATESNCSAAATPAALPVHLGASPVNTLGRKACQYAKWLGMPVPIFSSRSMVPLGLWITESGSRMTIWPS